MWHDLIGKGFEYGATGPDKYDCFNLCRELYRRQGISLPAFNSDTEVEKIHNSIEKGLDLFDKISDPEEGCLVMFMIRPPYVSHIGMVTKPPYFIHVMRKRLVVLERYDTPAWQWRIKGFYKWKN